MRPLSVLLLIAAAACATAQEQSDTTGPAAKICASVGNIPVPGATPESPADANWLRNCAADDLYYGASPHQDVDYAAARRCALYDWNVRHGAATASSDPAPANSDDSGSVYDFSTQTLIMIYANGDGVLRNLDLAIHLACKDVFPLRTSENGDSASGHDIELAQIILKLAGMKSAASPPRFDYCNGGAELSDWPEKLVCKSVDTRIARRKREARLAELVAPWTGEQKDAFNKAREAFSQFEEAEERTENTCPVPAEMCTMDIDDRLETEFAADIDRFEQGKLPAFTRNQHDEASDALYALYQRKLTQTVHSNGNLMLRIRDAERAWVVYRDAFVEFAKLRWPSVSGDIWVTFLTAERLKQLRSLPMH
jgi:uncharacterized protein YecT (DUF1311 family)